jgi:hypothetical protein
MASIYRYPYDMMDASTDYMLIESIEYKAQGANALPTFAPNTGVFEKLKRESAKYNIVLPMPNSILQANTAGWGDSRVNALAGSAVNAGIDALTAAGETTGNLLNSGAAGLKALGNSLKDDVSALASDSSMGTQVQNYLKAVAATSAVNAFAQSNITGQQVLARTSGQIVNQNLELLFNGVSLRPFNFAWDITPRDEKEALVVKDILYLLKQSQAPRKLNQVFLGSPDVWRLSYRHGTKVHGFLNRFKICALTNVTINYTASGAYSAYNDSMGTPVHIQLSLGFTELEPIYREDYDKYQGGSGF